MCSSSLDSPSGLILGQKSSLLCNQICLYVVSYVRNPLDKYKIHHLFATVEVIFITLKESGLD